MSETIPFWNVLFSKRLMFDFLSYSRSSPCDHSRKQSVLVYTTTFVKTRLNCDLNFVMKSLGKWLLLWATMTTFGRVQLLVHFFKRNFHEERQTHKSSVLITADTECWQMHCNKSALVRETSLTFRQYLRKYTKVGSEQEASDKSSVLNSADAGKESKMTDKWPLTHFIISKALTRGLAGHTMHLSISLLEKCCEKTGVCMCLLGRRGLFSNFFCKNFSYSTNQWPCVNFLRALALSPPASNHGKLKEKITSHRLSIPKNSLRKSYERNLHN